MLNCFFKKGKGQFFPVFFCYMFQCEKSKLCIEDPNIVQNAILTYSQNEKLKLHF